MYYFFGIEVFKSEDYTQEKKFGLFFGKPFISAVMIAKIAAAKKVHYKIKVRIVLKSTDHVDDERVVELRKKNTF